MIHKNIEKHEQLLCDENYCFYVENVGQQLRQRKNLTTLTPKNILGQDGTGGLRSIDIWVSKTDTCFKLFC